MSRTRTSTAALVLAAALLPGCAIAQTSTAGEQTAAPSSSDNTYETNPSVDPARPTVTNPAHIPAPGYLQFEQGLLRASNTPAGPENEWSIVQTTKLSLNHHLMAFFSSQPFSRSVTSGVPSTDPGDLDVGMQVVLLDKEEGHSPVPSVALAYSNRVRTGAAANLDTGAFSRSLLVLASGDIAGFHYDSNFIVNEQQADTPNLPNRQPARRAQFGQTLSIAHDITPKISITGEIWRLSQPLTHGNAIGSLWVFNYSVQRTLVLDGGFSKGLTNTSTGWETFVGFSYLLPHRLWPLRAHHT